MKEYIHDKRESSRKQSQSKIQNRPKKKGKGNKKQKKKEKEKEKEKENNKCSICLLDIDNKTYAELECKHQYHFDCINGWSKINNACCVCRKKFTQIKKYNDKKTAIIEVENKQNNSSYDYSDSDLDLDLDDGIWCSVCCGPIDDDFEDEAMVQCNECCDYYCQNCASEIYDYLCLDCESDK